MSRQSPVENAQYEQMGTVQSNKICVPFCVSISTITVMHYLKLILDIRVI